MPLNSSTVLTLDGDTFNHLRAAGDRINEKRDCAVIAVAAVASIPYDTSHTLFHHFGRRHRCGTPFSTTKKVLDHLSYQVHDVTKFYDPSSVRSLAPMLPASGTFLIRTRGHIVAVVNGIVHDWSAMRKLYVQHVYAVTAAPAADAVSEYQPFPVPTPPTYVLPKGSVDTFKPTHAVHEVSERMLRKVLVDSRPPENPAHPDYRRWWSTFRAKVVAECIAHGIHKTTASVQVGKWIRGVSPSAR